VPTAPLVEFNQIGFAPASATILRDLDLTIEPGDVLAVAGANGSGKTTLLRLIATMLRPTAGSWSILETTASSRRDALAMTRRQISLVGHEPALWDELTLRENIELIDRLDPGADIADPLNAVGLANAANRRAGEASLGMRRRVEFARVLRKLPRLLLLDEAHAGLDAQAASIIDEVIDRVRSAGGAVVVVSHETARIEHLATRQCVLVGGRLEDRS